MDLDWKFEKYIKEGIESIEVTAQTILWQLQLLNVGRTIPCTDDSCSNKIVLTWDDVQFGDEDCPPYCEPCWVKRYDNDKKKEKDENKKCT